MNNKQVWCECISQIKKDNDGHLARALKECEKLTVTDIEFKDVAFIYSQNGNGKAELQMKTCSTLEIKVEERKRAIKKRMVHTHCPFCGTKYPESA